MSNIKKTRYRGEWIDLGINKWKDLLTHLMNNIISSCHGRNVITL